jgi:hypothetical protein
MYGSILEKNVLNLDRNLRTCNSIKSIGNLISLGVVLHGTRVRYFIYAAFNL